jgi:hypothetical protein
MMKRELFLNILQYFENSTRREACGEYDSNDRRIVE